MKIKTIEEARDFLAKKGIDTIDIKKHKWIVETEKGWYCCQTDGQVINFANTQIEE